MRSSAPLRARRTWPIVVGVIAIALLLYAGANWAVLHADACAAPAWYPKDLAELRSQLGQFGDFINPFLTLATVLFVLATYRHQLSEARRHEESQALSRYEDAVRSVQFIARQAPDRAWTGREAFFRFFADAEPKLQTVRQLADSQSDDARLQNLIEDITDGQPLNANFDNYGHCFQHAYLAMLEVVDLSDQPAQLPLSDIELLFYLRFITRLMRSQRDPHGQRALEMIARILKERGYERLCVKFLQRGA